MLNPLCMKNAVKVSDLVTINLKLALLFEHGLSWTLVGTGYIMFHHVGQKITSSFSVKSTDISISYLNPAHMQYILCTIHGHFC